MDITTVSSLAIIGVVVTALVQFLKDKFGGGNETKLIVLALSIVGGTAYYFLKSHTELLMNILSVLAIADMVYTYVWKYFETSKV